MDSQGRLCPNRQPVRPRHPQLMIDRILGRPRRSPLRNAFREPDAQRPARPIKRARSRPPRTPCSAQADMHGNPRTSMGLTANAARGQSVSHTHNRSVRICRRPATTCSQSCPSTAVWRPAPFCALLPTKDRCHDRPVETPALCCPASDHTRRACLDQGGPEARPTLLTDLKSRVEPAATPRAQTIHSRRRAIRTGHYED